MNLFQISKFKTEQGYSLLFSILCLYLVGLSFFPNRIAYAVREDGPVENLTAILAFLGAYFCVQIFILRRKYLGQNAWLVLLGFLPFFFMGGEEISWGQRVLEFRPVIYAGDVNYQREFTLHNMNLFYKFIYMGGFICVVVGGAVFPLLAYLLRPVRKTYERLHLPLMPVSVLWGMWLGFLLMVAARQYRPAFSNPFYFAWDVPFAVQEWREFYFSLALFAYVFGDYFYLLKYHKAYDYGPSSRT